MHPSSPSVSLYVPFEQAVHVPPFWPAYPALQKHCSGSVLSFADRLFSGQSMHCSSSVAALSGPYLEVPQLMQVAEPCVSLYVPAVQAAHVPPSAPV